MWQKKQILKLTQCSNYSTFSAWSVGLNTCILHAASGRPCRRSGYRNDGGRALTADQCVIGGVVGAGRKLCCWAITGGGQNFPATYSLNMDEKQVTNNNCLLVSRRREAHADVGANFSSDPMAPGANRHLPCAAWRIQTKSNRIRSRVKMATRVFHRRSPLCYQTNTHTFAGNRRRRRWAAAQHRQQTGRNALRWLICKLTKCFVFAMWFSAWCELVQPSLVNKSRKTMWRVRLRQFCWHESVFSRKITFRK